jgi:hypothetical protein
MSSTSDSFGRRAGRAFTRLVVTLLVFALLGAVGFLLSRLNSRTFTLQQQDGKLLVMKGRMLPLGSEPYRPSDPALAAAYAPIDLLGGTAAGLDGARFEERDAMDRGLFEFLEGLPVRGWSPTTQPSCPRGSWRSRGCRSSVASPTSSARR